MTKAMLPRSLRTRRSLVLLGLLELGLAYLTGSWAIDSGSLFAYGLSLFFLVTSLHKFYQAITYNRKK